MSTKYNNYILAITRKGKKGDKVTLHQRYYSQGVQWQVALNISVPRNQYDGENEVVTGNDAERYNRILAESKHTIDDIILRSELLEHVSPTPDYIKTKYLRIMEEKGLLGKQTKKDIDLLDSRIEEFINYGIQNREWTDSTEKKFKTLKRYIHAYREKKGIKLTFDTLTDEQLYDFMDWARTEKHLLNTTAEKQVKLLVWYLRWCAKMGYYSGNSYETFQPKYKGTNTDSHQIIYLTEEELNKLESFTFQPNQTGLSNVRDMFVFACYCGLRFSDVQKLRPYQIHHGVIDVVMKKTDGYISINLNKHTQAILDKYKEHAELTGFVFPRISNQKANVHVHEMCEMCGIDEVTMQVRYRCDKREEVWLPKYELVTFHASRRTFITHALRLGIPPSVIVKFSGHKKLEMLKPYMEVVDELKKKEMAKFDTM